VRKRGRADSWKRLNLERLELCYACQYIDENLFKAMDKKYESVIGMLSRMEQQAHKFCY
jgi:hypothetical protein